MKGKLIYTEKQNFKNTFFYWLELAIALTILGGLAYGISVQIINGKPWGTSPMSDTALLITAAITFIILGGIHWLFTTMSLVIEIDAGNLYYSYFPFVSSQKTISKNDIQSLEVRKYKPIMEYGGWGYRISPRNGKAFNIKGSWGLQLVLSNGDKLLLGTQKPEELKKAIEQLKESWNEY